MDGKRVVLIALFLSLLLTCIAAIAGRRGATMAGSALSSRRQPQGSGGVSPYARFEPPVAVAPSSL